MTKFIIYSIFLLNISCTIFAERPAYWIQIKATASEDTLSVTADSLEKLHIPFEKSSTEKNGTKFYRLRVGPFIDSSSVQKFVEFSDFDKPWVIKTKISSEILSTIKSVILDTTTIVNKKASYYVSNECNFFALYIYNYGIELARLPSDLRIYLPPDKIIKLQEVTGFLETSAGIEFGKNEKVFFNPDGLPLEEFSKEIDTYSFKNGIPVSEVRKNISYFNDGMDAYFVRLGFVSLNGALKIEKSKGFDYVESSFDKIKHTGDIQDKKIGNFALKEIDISKTNVFSCKNNVSLLKSKNGEHLLICNIIKGK